jgi:hypothetical protein
MLISACKDGNPMLRSWLGDWIGTFLGELGYFWDAGRHKKDGGEVRWRRRSWKGEGVIA